MCGIAGAIGRIEPEVVRAIQVAAKAQQHRGPDDEGFWQSAPFGGDGAVFAFRRLSILDLTADGHQPMADPSTGNVIAFNGELYNFRELRRELETFGRTFRSTGDTEVILQAYAQWGPQCFTRMCGMFAVAIWDAHARCIVLARDRVGIKPLFVATVERGCGQRVLLFASEVRALLATGLVPRRMSRTAVASYVWNGFVVGPQTIVDGVTLLPAGVYATVECRTGRQEFHRYWQMPEARPAPGGMESLQHELDASVRRHLESDVPVGVCLSGGVDSSAVAALAAQAQRGGHRLHTFHIAFEESGYDESRFAALVAHSVGAAHSAVTLTQRRFQAQLEPALRSLDQPTFDGINSYFVSRAVREAGVTVALSGAGGDELFGGYRSFRDLPRAARLCRALRPLPSAMSRLLARALLRLRTGRFGDVPPQTRWGKLGDLLATGGNLVALYQTAYALFRVDTAGQLLSRGLPDELRWGLPARRYAELSALVGREPRPHAISLVELAMFVGERLVRDMDSASMAVSLETRLPLLDHRVIEAAARVPERDRFEPLGRKSVLRAVAATRLDPSIFERRKAGFVLPLELWTRQELGGEVERVLLDDHLCAACGLDPATVLRVWRAFSARAPGLYWSRVWALFTLLWWAREYRVSL